jgi:hypothetical protein
MTVDDPRKQPTRKRTAYVQLPSLLRSEHVIRAVILALTDPTAEGYLPRQATAGHDAGREAGPCCHILLKRSHLARLR